MMFPLEKIKLACLIVRHFNERNTVQVTFPFEKKILMSTDDQTLSELYNELTSERYVPSNAYIIDVPKGRGLIRHLSYLTVKDQILYVLIAIDCFPAIFSKISNYNTNEAEEILKQYPLNSDWMKQHIRGDLMEKRRPIFDKGFKFILNSDISAFGPNIDIDKLCAELKDAGASLEPIIKLSKCLRKWSPLGHKGIPQVYFTTDLIAEFYLEPIDTYFKSLGDVVYLRESDNIEIWCKTESSCKEMLIHLSRLLYERGLYLNNFKTNIIRENSIDRNEHPMEHKKYNWRNDFKERFRGMMNLYYKLIQNISYNECYNRLKSNPEFTEPLLDHYFKEGISINKSLLKYLSSQDAIYKYQNYLLIRWLYNVYGQKENGAIEVIRQIAWDKNNPYYLQSVARHFIYKFGNDNDRTFIRKYTDECTDPFEMDDMLFLKDKNLEFSTV